LEFLDYPLERCQGGGGYGKLSGVFILILIVRWHVLLPVNSPVGVLRGSCPTEVIRGQSTGEGGWMRGYHHFRHRHLRGAFQQVGRAQGLPVELINSKCKFQRGSKVCVPHKGGGRGGVMVWVWEEGTLLPQCPTAEVGEEPSPPPSPSSPVLFAASSATPITTTMALSLTEDRIVLPRTLRGRVKYLVGADQVPLPPPGPRTHAPPLGPPAGIPPHTRAPSPSAPFCGLPTTPIIARGRIPPDTGGGGRGIRRVGRGRRLFTGHAAVLHRDPPCAAGPRP